MDLKKHEEHVERLQRADQMIREYIKRKHGMEAHDEYVDTGDVEGHPEFLVDFLTDLRHLFPFYAFYAESDAKANARYEEERAEMKKLFE